MTEQEKFEKWYDTDLAEPLPTNYTILGKRYLWMGWNACATEKDKELNALNDHCSVGYDLCDKYIETIAEKDKEIVELRQQVAKYDRWLSKGVYFTTEEYTKECDENRQALALRDLEIVKLREALQMLLDVQNGCPLPKYEKDYDEAIKLTNEALSSTSSP